MRYTIHPSCPPFIVTYHFQATRDVLPARVIQPDRAGPHFPVYQALQAGLLAPACLAVLLVPALVCFVVHRSRVIRVVLKFGVSICQ